MDGRKPEDDFMHRWIEPHGDLTSCGTRRWRGTRGEEPVTCPACAPDTRVTTTREEAAMSDGKSWLFPMRRPDPAEPFVSRFVIRPAVWLSYQFSAEARFIRRNRR